MDVRQLELFLAVMECSSITGAAKRVSLSPGAISLQLHNLAADLRTELFVRTGKRLQPTPAAYRLAELATVVLKQVRHIEHEFENDPAGDRRPFHFATGATALIHQLGRPLRMLRKRFPNTPLKITVCATEDMAAGLLERRFDLALISLPFEDEHLAILPTFEEEMLILKPSHAQVRGWHVGSIKPAELADPPFILYAKRSNVRTIIDGFFREIGVVPHVVMEADDTEVMKRLVEAGFGYAILPEHALHGNPRFFHLLRVAGCRIARHQALAMVRSEHPRALTESIARFLHGALTSK
ncbi:MAG TPA: LysR family transcriptional regulator [Bryobacteraceae bacterium]|jgi:LysR family nitrogen assimilation transcriptional regulator|nr:LysR family transcriptional regulator [Bryobacteraceae bacterium]